MSGVEFQQKVYMMKIERLNYYCPNDRPLSLSSVQVPFTHFIAAGDFNSHPQSWGYDQLDQKGEEIKAWQDEHFLVPPNRAIDIFTFYPRR